MFILCPAMHRLRYIYGMAYSPSRARHFLCLWRGRADAPALLRLAHGHGIILFDSRFILLFFVEMALSL
jgi:hypothetical protein